MSEDHPVYLLDITTGLTRKFIEFFQVMADDLAAPPGRDSIFPGNFKFEFSRIRVSVQLSEQRLDYDMARQRERDHIAGFFDKEKDLQRYKVRSIKAYEEQAKYLDGMVRRPVVRDWEDVRGDINDPTLRRAIILGDPGFGKSWLLYFDGWRLATDGIIRLKHGEVGTAAVQIPIFARLSDLAELKGPLLARLRALYCDGEQELLPHVRELWPLIEGKARRGEAVLLLDGWDEVRKNRKGLKTAIQAFVRRNQDCRIFITSRIAGYERLAIGANEWELVAFTPEQVKTFTEVFFRSMSGQEDKATALQANLQSNPRVMGLAGIPLLLALLCRLYSEKPVLPNRRVEIYEKTLEGLLWDWRRDDGEEKDRTEEEFSLEDKKEVLSQLSLKLFLESSRVDAWKLGDLEKKVRTIPGAPRSKPKAQRLLAKLIRDGVLVREGEKPGSLVRFIHLTFHEFLAASTLATTVNNNGWQARIAVGAQKHTIEHIIDKKSWDPNWQEVIILLAGQLAHPAALLQLLHNPKADDRMRDRTGVAALCLPMLKQEHRGEFTDHIAQEIVDLWWMGETFCDIKRVDAAARGSAKVIEQTLYWFENEDTSVHANALQALATMGEAAANHPKVIPALLRRLEIEDRGERTRVAMALGAMGEAAANHPKVIPALLRRLLDPTPSVRDSSAWALGLMGEAAAKHPKVIPALLRRLLDEERWVRNSTACALARMGQVAGSDPRVMPALLHRLQDISSNLVDSRLTGREELKLLAANQTQMIPYLLRRLESKNGETRANAANFLGCVGRTASHDPRVISALLSLREKNGCMTWTAAWALGELGPVASAYPRVIPALLQQLKNKSLYASIWVHPDAVQALGMMGETAANHPKVIPAVLRQLKDDYPLVRSNAARALGMMGKTAANHPKVIPALLRQLKDEQASVRSSAVQSLANLGVRVFEKGSVHYPWKTVAELSKL
jgi:HEAT repeat protein